MELILQKQPETSKFSGHPSSNRANVASPPSSSDSSCSDPDDEPDEHWDSGEHPTATPDYPPYYTLLDNDRASLSEGKEGKIPKVSSDHTISSSLYSPTESGKKKQMFFKKDSEEENRTEFVGNVSKPRLSLGDMRASWREFSGKHFGLEHGKQKKKNGDKDEG